MNSTGIRWAMRAKPSFGSSYLGRTVLRIWLELSILVSSDHRSRTYPQCPWCRRSLRYQLPLGASTMSPLTVHADRYLVAMLRGQDISAQSSALLPNSTSIRPAYSSKVDFPAPRYPVSSVIGILGLSNTLEGPASGSPSSTSSNLHMVSMHILPIGLSMTGLTREHPLYQVLYRYPC